MINKKQRYKNISVQFGGKNIGEGNTRYKDSTYQFDDELLNPIKNQHIGNIR